MKRLVAVDVTPDGDVVVVSGRNGQGKTSVLDAIWYALGGKDVQDARPVRDGTAEAQVTLDLGDYVVTRTWKRKDDGGVTTQLKVTAADGSRVASPQALLDGLVGDLSFDPLAFTRLHPRDQRRTLLRLAGVDVDDYDSRRRAVFDERTATNREVKRLREHLASLPDPGPDAPTTEVSSASVLESLRNAQDWQHVAETTRTARDAKAAQVDELERVLAQAREDLAVLEYDVSELPDPLPDPSVYQAQLDDLEVANRRAREAGARVRAADTLRTVQADAERLTTALTHLDEDVTSRVATAELPVRDLSYDEDGVTYLGVPFAQCSSAEQLRVSVAVAMAANPEVRVIRITDGSLLDSQSLAVIADMASRHDFQCWVERVADAGEGVGVVIEDGTVVGS